MSMFGDLLRRARLRGLTEGTVQVARAEALENDAKDDAERWQDYGFAANPVDGQGLVINVAGHTIVLRMDRLAERPHLAAHEVTVWHREGHSVTLKAGRLVQVSCDSLVVDASVSVTINSPTVTTNASSGVAFNTPTVSASDNVAVGDALTAATSVAAPLVAAADSLTVAGTEMREHRHSGVGEGTDTSGPPV